MNDCNKRELDVKIKTNICTRKVVVRQKTGGTSSFFETTKLLKAWKIPIRPNRSTIFIVISVLIEANRILRVSHKEHVDSNRTTRAIRGDKPEWMSNEWFVIYEFVIRATTCLLVYFFFRRFPCFFSHDLPIPQCSMMYFNSIKVQTLWVCNGWLAG